MPARSIARTYPCTQGRTRVRIRPQTHPHTHLCSHSRTLARTHAYTHTRILERNHVYSHAGTVSCSRASTHSRSQGRTYARTYAHIHADWHARTHARTIRCLIISHLCLPVLVIDVQLQQMNSRYSVVWSIIRYYLTTRQMSALSFGDSYQYKITPLSTQIPANVYECHAL